ncbi:twitching motility protein [Caldicellulosiruptor kronotskyensis 2002]|uniref:Twitching motility protein n=1 Tax=Caldicellulosiruptor kronotskyensis (strain DSM 18902 / VKM B-2412 / 2002) TaxID=632348 RepID=E4SB57_CALK2|nr:type IV pilus twitching motility protein PilT [Caldicellulosiruptor kronotskyensis]ADQ45712.1 twitching motility protein [Caldicellulosiruptor kronotskyensis 2002]
MDINSILKEAFLKEASDIHITPGVPPIYRIHGRLVRTDDSILTPEMVEEFVRQITNENQFKILEQKGEIDFSYGIKGVSRFRVNVYKQRGSYSIAFRIIPVNIPPFETLGLPPVLKEFTKLNKGLVLVTGPTGSGKSTTLASLIDIINKERDVHIITLEDPIEYLHRHNKSIINQREIGSDTLSFADALRAALREDPDVILVGEMRDLETIAIALTAAETGHLVFSTLHTIGAAKTIDRIIDVFPPHQQQQIRIQLSTVLQGVVSQQLLTRRDGKGRVVATEVMIVNPAIRNLIREAKTYQIQSIIQTHQRQGMITMEQSLIDLYKRGFITREDAFNYATDFDFMQRLLSA